MRIVLVCFEGAKHIAEIKEKLSENKIKKSNEIKIIVEPIDYDKLCIKIDI